MPQDKFITTFQFLEEIQETFLKTQKGGNADARMDTRRVVNFFDNTAKLHVVKAEDALQRNGSASPLAILSIQSVAKDGEISTFAVNIEVQPSEKQQKMLLLVHDVSSLKTESSRIVKLLNLSIEQSAKKIAESVAETPIATETAPIRSAEAAPVRPAEDASRSSDDASRLSRRTRLRGRDE